MNKFDPKTTQEVSAIKAELAKLIKPVTLRLAPVKNGELVDFEFRNESDVPIVYHEIGCPCFKESAIYEEGHLLKGVMDSTAHKFTQILWFDGKHYYREAQAQGGKVLHRLPDYARFEYDTKGMEEVKAAPLNKDIMVHFAQVQTPWIVDKERRLLKENPLYIRQKVNIRGFSI